jgi:hypothetical protein
MSAMRVSVHAFTKCCADRSHLTFANILGNVDYRTLSTEVRNAASFV